MIIIKKLVCDIVYSFMIVGAIVGIGFISGSEIVSFFHVFGKWSYLLVCLFFVLFSCVVYVGISQNKSFIKKRKNEKYDIKNSFKTLKYDYKYINNKIKKYNKIHCKIMSVFYFFVIAVMLSGVKFLFQNFWISDKFLTAIFMVGLLLFLSFLSNNNNDKIRVIASIITIVLFVVMIINILLFLENNNLDSSYINNVNFENKKLSVGLISLILYLSMNTMSCSSVFSKIKSKNLNNYSKIFIAILSSFLLSFVMLICIVLFNSFDNIYKYEMPLVFVSIVNGDIKFLYIILLFLGSIISLFNVVSSGVNFLFFDNEVYYRYNNKILSCFIYLLIAFGFSFLNFSLLVGVVYRVVGFCFIFLSIIKFFLF